MARRRVMAKHQGAVLVDTNVILEAHRTGSWRALSGGYRVETVEDCVAETQTGFQLRKPERQIDRAELLNRLEAVHVVEEPERAGLALGIDNIALDKGEASLWAHALTRKDDWVLCGPDRASLRCGVRLGFRERLVPLEGLLNGAGHRPRPPLRKAYSRRWHSRALADLVLDENDGI